DLSRRDGAHRDVGERRGGRVPLPHGRARRGRGRQRPRDTAVTWMQWDNTTLFADDDPADRAFRAEVRDWVAANCPKELRDRPLRIDPPELKPWHRRLYERGWIAPHWPKEAGGMGATLTQQIILFEEMSRIGAPTPYPHGLSFIGPLIIDAGTPEQKA